MPDDAPVTMANLRWLIIALPNVNGLAGCEAGLEDDLGVGVLIVVPVTVHVRPILQAGMVRNEEGRIELALADHLEQLPRVFLDVRLPRLDRQAFLHERAEREFVSHS